MKGIMYQRSNKVLEMERQIIRDLKIFINEQLPDITCRLCLKPEGKKIFDNRQEFDIVKNINCILGIEVKENDGKPQHICMVCERVLIQAAELKQTAERTQWRLDELMVSNQGYDSDSVQEEIQDDGDLKSEAIDVAEAMGPECKTELTDEDWELICKSVVPDEDIELKCEKEFGNNKVVKPKVRNKLLTINARGSKCKMKRSRMQMKLESQKKPPLNKRSKIKSSICETCGKEIKGDPKRHRLIHTGELKFQCPDCPYRGRTKYALRQHSHTHNSQQRVQCPHCPRTFSWNACLYAHLKIHFPPKYSCNTCGKKMRCKKTLKNHEATHSGLCPFVCEQCDKSFSTKNQLRRHEIKAHNRPKMPLGVHALYLQQSTVAGT